jgi:hypothetical protein
MYLIELEFASSAEFTDLGHAFAKPKSEGINMKILSGPQRRRSQAGVALLIAIFVLLLIGVTAIALILSSGAESALAGNYRSSASVYYAALAGIEEARGRLLPSNPDYFGAFVAPPGTQLPLGQVRYILNPLPGEIVNPTDLGNASTYPDTEYQNEFGTPITGAAVQTINSVSPAAGLPGPLYKWVRINAATERSLNVDVDSKHSPSTLDSITPLYYDSACADTSPANPGSSLCLNHSPNAVQALEITALASLPNGSQKLLQYIVAPSMLNLNFTGSSSSNVSFPSALTLVGNNVNFDGPSSTAFNINGNDQFSVGACAPGPNPVSAIGYTNGADSSLSNILKGNVTANSSHYLGAGTMSPNVSNVTGLPPNLQTPSGLDRLVQTITQGADAIITGPATQSDSNNVFPPAMTSSNSNPNPIPMTVVVNGDLSIYNWHYTGFGLLVVTGTLTYDPDASWKGMILVIGQGQFVSTRAGSGQIDGAVLVAKTRDAAGNLLPDPNLGAASFVQTGGGYGIYYSTCWINAVAGPQRPTKYQVLSYHELSQ